MKTKHNGFTLVELSIVLVILGLLIGGVLTGQSLIRAAELRSITTQYSGFITATQTFRDKYFALPGDMTNATKYWGAATAPCQDKSTQMITCDGNGDGRVITSSTSFEQFRFWQHLVNAGLIEGNYDGTLLAGNGNSAAASFNNSPPGKLSSTIWAAYYNGTPTETSSSFGGNFNNSLQFGGYTPNAAPNGPALKPEEAYNVDMKMDDGAPGNGKIIGFKGDVFNQCTSAAGTAPPATGATYKLTNTSKACYIYFIDAF